MKLRLNRAGKDSVNPLVPLDRAAVGDDVGEPEEFSMDATRVGSEKASKQEKERT